MGCHAANNAEGKEGEGSRFRRGAAAYRPEGEVIYDRTPGLIYGSEDNAADTACILKSVESAFAIGGIEDRRGEQERGVVRSKRGHGHIVAKAGEVAGIETVGLHGTGKVNSQDLGIAQYLLTEGAKVVVPVPLKERAIYTGTNKPAEPIFRHSGYPGGIKSIPKGELLAKRPEEAILRTVKKMLPHNALGLDTFHKLKVYAGETHPHEAQIKGTPSPERALAIAKAANEAMRRTRKDADAE